MDDRMKKKSIPMLFHTVGMALLMLLALQSCKEQGKPQQEKLPPNVFEDSIRVQIADLQHQRDGAGLLEFARGGKKEYRLAAINGLASVQDSNAVPALLTMLSDNDTDIVVASAYALGQTGKGAVELLAAGMAMHEEDAALLILEACGKSGTEAQLDSLVHAFSDLPERDARQAGYMAACYRFGTRSIVRPATAGHAYALIQSGSATARHWACAFVGRVGALGLEQDSVALLAALAVQMPADDLQHLVKRLGKCDTAMARPRLEAYLLDEGQDWRVRVSALRALRGLGDGWVTPGLRTVIQSEIPALAMEGAAYLLEFCGKRAADDGLALSMARSTAEPVLKASLLAAAVKHAEGKGSAAAAHTAVMDQLAGATDATVRGLCYLALSFDAAHEAFLAAQLAGAAHGPEATGLMTGLSQLYARKPGKASDRLATIKAAVASGDVALIGIAAGVLRDPAAGLDKAVNDTAFLVEAQNRLQAPRDIETIQEIQRTLNHLGGRPDAVLPPLPAAPPIQWSVLKALPTGQIWVIETNKGKIRIALDIASAPATVANMARLIREGYFDGKLFHRVVPNFVAQAGCPRGDGWGSVEPMVRSEWPGTRFTEGAVGMASAGKDTESCQFFITHCSTPHLDGRYTVFGYVKSGMEVVQQLNIGDRITRSFLE
jgi:cyclophilin family peptidyl-prolyl cis-trans isomerase/HEAT repeat protein